ncbi:hypothetical protein [Aestuariivirga sp.]
MAQVITGVGAIVDPAQAQARRVCGNVAEQKTCQGGENRISE